MNNDELREKTIELMTDFMMDVLYKGTENLDRKDVADNACIYYDLVAECQKQIKMVESEEAIRKIAAQAQLDGKSSPKGVVDASNPTQVDLMGGPRAIDNSTVYKG